jgi:hypothetical protein
MKITKKLIKQIIQEELEAQLEEQVSSFVAAGEEAARRREKAMQGPSAIEKLISDPSAIEKAAAAAEPKKTKPAKNVRKKARPSGDPQTQTMQQIYNMALKRINSKLPPLETDGLHGPKTRIAGQEIRKYIRKNLPRGTTIAAGIEQILGAGMKTLRQVARRKILDNDRKAMATPKGKEEGTNIIDQSALRTLKGLKLPDEKINPKKVFGNPDKEEEEGPSGDSILVKESFKRFL